jgi:hypothetical protein
MRDKTTETYVTVHFYTNGSHCSCKNKHLEQYQLVVCRSGSSLDPECSSESVTLSTDAKCYLIVDTHTVLQQADFLDHPSVTDVIVLSSVFQEVQHKNTGVFLRLKQMLASTTKHFYYFSNEHCQVRITTATRAQHLSAATSWPRVHGKLRCCVQSAPLRSFDTFPLKSYQKESATDATPKW